MDKIYGTGKTTQIETIAIYSNIQMGDFQRPRRRFVLGAWLSALGQLRQRRAALPPGLFPRRASANQPV
jgi:hypothetical protein